MLTGRTVIGETYEEYFAGDFVSVYDREFTGTGLNRGKFLANQNQFPAGINMIFCHYLYD